MTPEEKRHLAAMGQGTGAHLAELLPRLTGESWDDFTPIRVGEDGSVTMTHDQGWLLYEMALRSLPRCFAVTEGYATDDDCQMPNGVCHSCAAEGRSLPASHPLRAGKEQSA